MAHFDLIWEKDKLINKKPWQRCFSLQREIYFPFPVTQKENHRPVALPALVGSASLAQLRTSGAESPLKHSSAALHKHKLCVLWAGAPPVNILPEVVSSFDSHTYPHLRPMPAEYPIYRPSTDSQKISLPPYCCKMMILNMRNNTAPGRYRQLLHWCWYIWASKPRAIPMLLYFMDRPTRCWFLQSLGNRSLTQPKSFPWSFWLSQ